jgi:putative zinc finger/helix-turn-helix YgiT family protein
MSSTCPVCGVGHIVNETLLDKFEYLGSQLEALKTEEYCDSCGTLLQLPETIRANLRNVQRAKIVHDGLLTGDEISKFRDAFQITQLTASSLFGGGKVAFSKYECDEIAHNASMDRLLRLCILAPANILLLAEITDTVISKEIKAAIDDNASKRLIKTAQQAQLIFDKETKFKPKLTLVSSNNDVQMSAWDARKYG